MPPDRIAFVSTKVTLLRRIVTIAVAVLTVAGLAVAAVTVKTTRDRRMAFADRLATAAAISLDALANRVNEEQDTYLWITPPGSVHSWHQGVGIVAFDWKAFPEEFTRSLIPVTEKGCPVYPITLVEDPTTRDMVVYNAENKAIYAIHPHKDYDPYRVLKKLYPEFSSGRYPPAYVDWLTACYDPARVVIQAKLLPAEWIELYAENAYPAPLKKVPSTLDLSGGVTLMRSMAAESNIVCESLTFTATGAVVEIGHPDDFTGRLDIYRIGNLVAGSWEIAVTNLATNGTGTLFWTDTSATNAAIRFYAAADGTVDTDGDGLGDGRERFIYHTTDTNRDSDVDGLVDGYSGVVATNLYPTGATTNGGQYVEGELTWHTDAQLPDTDDDGMEDGWEVGNGHDPTNWNDPPNVRGTVTYVGRQTGAVWVVSVTASNSWSTNASAVLNALHGYRIPHLEATNYWINAWMDSNDSGTNDSMEARGMYAATATVITNRVLGIDFALTDPDDDGDSLPDYWEVASFGNTTNTATGDPDGDEYTNLEEYQADTDPTNTLSHPWNISGTISYIGPQTGTIHVIACTSSNSWVATQYTTNALPGAYTITHLPPGTSYWIRAWRDSDANGSLTASEAQGSAPNNPVVLTANAAGVDVTLTDPDQDNDGLADWWEVKYGLSTAHPDRTQAAGWWALDETSRTNVSDSSVHTNHGILQNAGTNGAWGAGVLAGALTFDGTNDTVQVPDSTSLKPNYVSVSLWVCPSLTYTNGSAALFSKRTTAGTTGYSLGCENGALAFTICASGAKTLRYPCTLTNGAWVHVAGTYAGEWQRLYVNGIEVVSTNHDWNTGFGYISHGEVSPRLGSTPDATPTNLFAGSLDDVLVFSGTLASNTVRDLYDLGADPDHDGLTTFTEYQLGTSPNGSDSDGDGVNDAVELVLRTDPTNADTTPPTVWLDCPTDGEIWSVAP